MLKAISKFKSLLSEKRAATPTATTEEIEQGIFDPAEEKARAEEIEALLAQRREFLSKRARISEDDYDDSEDGESPGKGHARDISDQEPLYLGIGTSSKHSFYLDEEKQDIVADSPSAVDYNIYDRAYEQAIKDRLDENPKTKPIMYLTKFVKETDHFKTFENIVEGAMFAPAAMKEQVRETKATLYEHFSSPSTTKLSKLVARVGLADPPHSAEPIELNKAGFDALGLSEDKTDGSKKSDSANDTAGNDTSKGVGLKTGVSQRVEQVFGALAGKKTTDS